MAATPAELPPTEPGIGFAPDASGSRSTQAAGRRILAAALEPLHADHAAQALAERDWRQGYPRHWRHLVEDSLAAPGAVVAGAQAGLQAAWQSMEWRTAAGTCSLAAALDSANASGWRTVTLQGEGDPAPQPWSVPLGDRLLQGDALLRQIDDWCQRGIIEPGAAEALARCVAHPEWFDLRDRTLVLLGAASEAGPLAWLLRWRANLVAVDRDRPAVWQRLAALARTGNGVLHAPLRGDAGGSVPGVDLLRDAPALAAWLATWRGTLDIAALAYLDGERHVRLVLAMDMVQAALCAARPDTGLAFLATPTDVFVVPRAVQDAAQARYAQRPLASRIAQGALALVAGRRFFQPPYSSANAPPEGAYGVADSLVLQQGPNYALAKRLQQWRAIVARAAGHRVSLNVAPSTTTASVLGNPALAAGFAGADLFGVEVFAPATTNALMAALWVHDLRHPGAPAHPATRLAHPLAHFMEQACHGGLWRCPYLPRSALPFAAAAGWLRQRGLAPRR